MSLQNQVLTIKQMNHLRDLGISTDNASLLLVPRRIDDIILDWKDVENEGTDSDPLYKHYMKDWGICSDVHVEVISSDDEHFCLDKEEYKTFTLQDILDKIPKYTSNSGYEYSLRIDDLTDLTYERYDGRCTGYGNYNVLCQTSGDTLLEAAYDMLCRLIEKNIIEAK